MRKGHRANVALQEKGKLLGHLGAVSCAAALAFAAVFGFAAVVAALAATLALAIVFAFTGVLPCILGQRRVAERRYTRRDRAVSIRGCGCCLHTGCATE